MKKQNRRCGIVFKCGDRILCVHQKASGLIGAPKGLKEANETDEECALREFKEETGIILTKECLQNAQQITTIYNHVYFIVETDVLCDPSVNTFDHNEIEKLEWIKLEDLTRRPIASFTKHLIFKLQNSARTNAMFYYCSKIVAENAHLYTQMKQDLCPVVSVSVNDTNTLCI